MQFKIFEKSVMQQTWRHHAAHVGYILSEEHEERCRGKFDRSR
jgi:hypothetical protein